MGIKASGSLRRPGLAVIVRWSGALIALGLLMATLLSLPFQLYAVRTGSMEPTFGPRALVVVRDGEFQQGQPITFTHHGAVITHRFESVNADGTIVTQGDANKTPDPWVVQRREVIGGVIASAPGVGYWLVYLKTWPGFGSVFFAGAGLFILWPIARELDDRRSPVRVGDSGRPARQGLGRVVSQQIKSRSTGRHGLRA